MMAKNKKYIILLLCAAFFCLLIVKNIALNKDDAPGIVNPDTKENLKTPTPVLLQPEVLPPPLSGIPSKQKKIKESTAPSGQIEKEKIFSALFDAIAVNSQFDALSTEELFSILYDRDVPFKDRRQSAWALAKSGDSETLNELEKFLFQDGTPIYLKVTIVEGLGYSDNPQARKIIKGALAVEDDFVIRGAIRGLAAIGDKDALTTLSDMFYSQDVSKSVKREAAIGLGRSDDPEAYKILVDAFDAGETFIDEDFRIDIISALGYRNITETGAFFQKILNNKSSALSLRLAVVEAVQDAQGDTSSFLIANIDDHNPEIREEIIWGLSLADDPGDLSDVLQNHLVKEADAGVRKRIYQALSDHETRDVDFDIAADIIFSESETATKMAGYHLLATQMYFSDNTDLKEQFETVVIPELKKIALSDENLDMKLRAILSLKSAGTAESVRALEEIAARSLNVEVVNATGF